MIVPCSSHAINKEEKDERNQDPRLRALRRVGYTAAVTKGKRHATAGGPVARTTMSDTPVIFKRSKFKANQRAREGPQQDAQEQRVQSTEDEPSPSALASKIRNKARQRVQPKTSLSFGAEEEVSPYDTSFLNPHHVSQEGNEEVFKIKKSSLSQKLTLRQHPASPGCDCRYHTLNFVLTIYMDQGCCHPTWIKPAYLPILLRVLSTMKPT
jgi:hypothetical protein